METQVDPEAEVKKLQSLVKKLEKQNELLRSRAGGIGGDKIQTTPQNSRVRNKMAISSSHSLDLTNHSNDRTPNSLENGTTDKDRANYSLLDDSVQLLDSEISDMMNEEEDSWLYVSPLRVLTPEERSVNVYDWIRQDLDHPSDEMESAKRSLQAKLDELARAQRNSVGTNSLVIKQPVMVDASVGVGRLESSPSPSPTSVHPGASAPTHFPYQSSTTPRTKGEAERRERERRISGDRKSSEELGYSKLEDVTDVQILAKMQEESLRQAMHQSPSNSPRRATTGVSPASSENTLHKPASRTNSHGSNADKDEAHEAHVEASTKTSTVVRRRPSLERMKKGEGDTRRYSYGAKMTPNHTSDNGDSITIAELQKLALERQAVHKGSLPNLNRTYTKETSSPPSAAPQPMPSTTTTPTSTTPATNHSDPTETRLKHPTSPSPTRSLPSPGKASGLKQPSPSKMRNASPQRSGIPVRSSASAERSGIPRPRSAVLSPRSQMLVPGNRRGDSPAVRDPRESQQSEW
ncbi:SLAIN motif-containing protein 2-like isoform X2 [Acanthaster planci]|uniref:SLAIN motif-containing protein 2-like isoform X2 n=1 Tax=Acanthaster planci TaxID=133434 RepID=A0A8B7XYG3_ACAPL|nr:SLAIN motif-containing protein 2-like isoform X2 [Acanthaster planci]XP_022084816.1 SLAIN motif-containing protein 2-like isoform X2 [Acanthaster planci]